MSETTEDELTLETVARMWPSTNSLSSPRSAACYLCRHTLWIRWTRNLDPFKVRSRCANVRTDRHTADAYSRVGLKRLRRIEELPPADQRAVLKLVDAMLETRRRTAPVPRGKRKAS